MDEWFNPTLYNGCNYLSMLELNLIHVSNRGPRCPHGISIYSEDGIIAKDSCRKHWITDIFSYDEMSLNVNNSLRPSDAYMRQLTNHHRFRWWLVAWTAPSQYLNQNWNIINWNFRNKPQWNFNRNSNIFIQENAFENIVCEMASICLGLNVLTEMIFMTKQHFMTCGYHYTSTFDSLRALETEWSWWRQQMETLSALLAFCAGNLPVTGELPSQMPVTQSFDVFFHLMKKQLSKQSWG